MNKTLHGYDRGCPGRYAVWAPHARTVELLLETHAVAGEPEATGGSFSGGVKNGDAGVRIVMSRSESGWWQAETPLPSAGERYAFSLDGGPARPDPRSRRQPDGVHAFSQWVDESLYNGGSSFGQTGAMVGSGFRPPALETGIIYELHIGTFTADGTLDAAIDRLDYLRELGITHVELMPVAAASGTRGWGYDGVALYAVYEAYGGPEALIRFVEACHIRGMAVMLDVVYNHLGPEGNYLAEFGPYFTDSYRTPWGSAVNFDGADSDEVRRFVIDNALMWFRDYRIDALRIDAVHALHDESAMHILEQLAVETHRLSIDLGRPIALIAESDLNDPVLVTSREAGGYGLDAQWSDDFHHALHVALTDETHGYYAGFNGIDHIATSLREVFVHAGDYAPSRGRRHGRSTGTLHGSRFLAYSQNHDQVGNRATGERLCHLVSPARARIAAALTILSPFVPLLFQGEEWAATAPFQYFTDHGDVDLGVAVRKGRQREFRSFGWQPEQVPDPQAFATFERSRLDWDEQTRGVHSEMLTWYRALLTIRRDEPDLRFCDRGEVSVQCDPDAGWLHVRRGGIDIVAAFGEEGAAVTLAGVVPRDLLLVSDPSIQSDFPTLRFHGPGVAVSRRRR